MKAKDLMIGDYVIAKYNECIGEGRYRQWEGTAKVVSISSSYITVVYLLNDDDDITDCDENEIEPIPITPEILEKNGFKNDGHASYFYNHDFYDLEIREWSDGNWLVVLEDCEFNLPHSQVFVSHVHQLQHALRLFGTDKEIEL